MLGVLNSSPGTPWPAHLEVFLTADTPDSADPLIIEFSMSWGRSSHANCVVTPGKTVNIIIDVQIYLVYMAILELCDH